MNPKMEAQALLEMTAEVLTGLRTTFADYPAAVLIPTLEQRRS
jgi:hypothetical protein